jgi:hypothetical protein
MTSFWGRMQVELLNRPGMEDQDRDRHPGLHGADPVDRAAFGVGEVPVDIALAGDVWAGVAAAHRYHDVGLLGTFAG